MKIMIKPSCNEFSIDIMSTLRMKYHFERERRHSCRNRWAGSCNLRDKVVGAKVKVQGHRTRCSVELGKREDILDCSFEEMKTRSLWRIFHILDLSLKY